MDKQKSKEIKAFCPECGNKYTTWISDSEECPNCEGQIVFSPKIKEREEPAYIGGIGDHRDAPTKEREEDKFVVVPAKQNYLNVSIKEYEQMKKDGILMKVKEIEEVIQAEQDKLIEEIEDKKTEEGNSLAESLAYNQALEDIKNLIKSKI
jgi:hypothetical protein